MANELTKQLRKARPNLKVVSPLAHWIIMSMGIFNLFLGMSFMFAIDQDRVAAPLLIVNDVFTFKFWGVVFLAIGLVKLFSLKVNNWELARHSLLFGVAVKAAWMVALIIRTIVSPGTIFFALIWATLAAIQMGAYIWFMPPSTGEDYKQRKVEREA